MSRPVLCSVLAQGWHQSTSRNARGVGRNHQGRQHGSEFPVEIRLTPIQTGAAHASRLAIVGELTASIAHEINQPLGAILSNADAAEMRL